MGNANHTGGVPADGGSCQVPVGAGGLHCSLNGQGSAVASAAAAAAAAQAADSRVSTSPREAAGAAPMDWSDVEGAPPAGETWSQAE
jgi:hypothetical protein